MEPTDITCPDCETVFYVVWNRNLIYERPEYCPFCGSEIDYKALAEEAESEANDGR